MWMLAIDSHASISPYYLLLEIQAKMLDETGCDDVRRWPSAYPGPRFPAPGRHLKFACQPETFLLYLSIGVSRKP
jgi:hypothetical protein